MSDIQLELSSSPVATLGVTQLRRATDGLWGGGADVQLDEFTRFLSRDSYDLTQSTPPPFRIDCNVIQLDDFNLFVSQYNYYLTQPYPRQFSDEHEVIQSHSSY